MIKLTMIFSILFDNKINIKGLKYDASNLTKFLEQQTKNNFLKNLNKEISINIKEIDTNVKYFIQFNLIGYINNGNFVKIISKGEFEDGKYLDISLKEDKINKKKF